MRPGSNSAIARPRSREQHSARLNARPHKRVNVRKPFIVRVRARFACARDTMKVCLQITFACVIPLAVSLLLFKVTFEERTCALLRCSEPGREKRMACTMICRVKMCDTLTCRKFGELFTNCPLSLVKPRRLCRSRTLEPCLMVRSDTNLKSSNL